MTLRSPISSASSGHERPSGAAADGAEAAAAGDAGKTYSAKRRFWWPLAACGLLLFLVGASWLAPQHGSTLLRRFVGEHGSPAPRMLTRLPLYGEPVTEDGTLGYAAAAALLRVDTNRDGAGVRLLQLLDEQSPDRAAAVRELQPVIAALQRSAHATTIPELLHVGSAAVLAAVQRAAVDEAFRSDPPEVAVALWLDEARLVADLAWLLPAAWAQALWKRWTPESLAALPAPTLRLLANGLAQLDADWRLHEDVVGSLVANAQYWLEDGSTHGPDLDDRLRAWRRGFDVRAEELATCELLVRTLPHMQLPATDWPTRSQQWHTFLDGPMEQSGGSVLWWMSHLCDDEHQRFLDLARLRLLRLAVAFTLGDESVELADPFGPAPLQVELRDGEATFRSACTDEVLRRDAVRR